MLFSCLAGFVRHLVAASTTSSSSAGSNVAPPKSEEAGPQRISTKRRSGDTADKIITNSIDQEVNSRNYIILIDYRKKRYLKNRIICYIDLGNSVGKSAIAIAEACFVCFHNWLMEYKRK